MLALMEPTPENEEEFNDWYDTEHFPERSTCPGFLASRRMICRNPFGRFRLSASAWRRKRKILTIKAAIIYSASFDLPDACVISSMTC